MNGREDDGRLKPHLKAMRDVDDPGHLSTEELAVLNRMKSDPELQAEFERHRDATRRPLSIVLVESAFSDGKTAIIHLRNEPPGPFVAISTANLSDAIVDRALSFVVELGLSQGEGDQALVAVLFDGGGYELTRADGTIENGSFLLRQIGTNAESSTFSRELLRMAEYVAPVDVPFVGRGRIVRWRT